MACSIHTIGKKISKIVRISLIVKVVLSLLHTYTFTLKSNEKSWRSFFFLKISSGQSMRVAGIDIGRLIFFFNRKQRETWTVGTCVRFMSVIRYIGIRNYWATHTTWILFKIQAKLAHCKSNPLFLNNAIIMYK